MFSFGVILRLVVTHAVHWLHQCVAQALLSLWSVAVAVRAGVIAATLKRPDLSIAELPLREFMM